MAKKVKKKGRVVQKEKHAPVPVPQQSVSASEGQDDAVSVGKERRVCPHLDKGVDLEKVSSKIGSLRSHNCEDCREGAADKRAGKGKGKHGKKKGGGSDSKAIWVCLACGHFLCGGAGLPTTPESHAVRHARQHRHPLAVQFENPLLWWCFPCSTLIPVVHSEENDESKDVLSDIVKVIKAQHSEGASADVEDVWFGSGSVTSAIVSESTVSNNLDGRKGGYAVRGFVNLGNTCFFNSVMQNLLALNGLRDHFLNLEGSFGPMTISLKKLFIETSPGPGSRGVVNPRSFFACLCARAPQFKGFQQHDSHELLRCLLDGLCTEESNARKQTESSDENEAIAKPASTFVEAIFGGQLSSTVSCLECGHSSVVYEPFLDLSLSVPTKRPPMKKAAPVSRAKKPKLVPRRSGRLRPKLNNGADYVPAHGVTSLSPGGEHSGRLKSNDLIKEEVVVSTGDIMTLDSIDQNVVGDNKGSKSTETVIEKTKVPSEDSIWLDFLVPATVSIDHCSTSTSNDISLTQDIGHEDAGQNTLDSSRQDAWIYEEEATLSSSTLSLLDHLKQSKLLDDHDITSEIRDILPTEDSGSKDVVQNDALLNHDSESGSQVCSEESSLKTNFAENSWEDEPLLQVQPSEVLLLPYKEDTSTTSEILRGECDGKLSPVGYEQDSLDFGFGDMFDEPEVSAGHGVNPLSSDDKSHANEVAETSLTVVNGSGSDAEIDDTNAPVSIESCLAFFTKAELLSKDEHAWHCENCSKAMEEQRMRLPKNMQKPMSIVSVDGGTYSCPSVPLAEDNDCASTRVRDPDSTNIRENIHGSNESLVSDKGGKEDGNLDCILETNQAERSLVTSQVEDTKIKINAALPESSEFSSWSKTCSQASDSCTVTEPATESRQRESQFTNEEQEPEDIEDKEIDSKSMKVKRDATKRILIDNAPNILTIHLKRFSQDARGRLSKLSGHVDFRDTIDLRPYINARLTKRSEYKYRLVGVVEHLGSMRGGHYVAYIRGGTKSRQGDEENGDFVWYYASDAYVREASLEEVLRCEAYILFYAEI
ncbi:hypothetical protein RJ639_013102 [Escallonia herrerae]|uniref:ubiquitinyl hydrolase 1 n=1 Tax=Escallonia herrerae TaxID=1293975 RepID=A0AA89ARG0_9ASTE|nr:hypothetical protein RJ639_013102 [Escallonia herrerae]